MSELPVFFTLFGMTVTPYAACIAGAALLSLILLLLTGNRKLKGDSVFYLAVLVLPLALLGARLFYVAARYPNWYNMEIEAKGLGVIFNFTEGGFALWGAFGGAALAAVIVAKATNQKVGNLLDVMAAPAALMIALARFAEYFSGEGRGAEIENEAFWFFPIAMYDDWFEVWNMAVFIFEGVAALVILCLVLRYKGKQSGDKARLFTVLYCSVQVLLESLRRDNFLRWFLVRVSQLTAVIVLGVMIIVALVNWKKREGKPAFPKHSVLLFVVFLLIVGVCVAIEFGVDKSTIPHEVLYSALGVMAALLGTITWTETMKLLRV